ncbi:SGNH/GDSL hydrolase family protein [Enemella evansiae]|uniref:SGNH/GDSL hydrolase family protein n=1 Tax=Enemella evansiae TaxID=2016499 RepID=UPI00117CC947|nr:SGNH/GDSL hydrolase family protein [Enemella evansiae]
MLILTRALAGILATLVLLVGGTVGLVTAWAGSATTTFTATGPSASAAARTETVVGLGDSVTSGFAADESYVEDLASSLTSSDTAARADNYGVAGLTTTGLLAQLALPGVRASLADADVVVITIGANDFTVLDADSAALPAQLAALRADVGQILTEVQAYAPGARVVLTGYWNAFTDASISGADQAYTDAAMGLTRQLNDELQQAAAEAGVEYVDLIAAFDAASTDWATLLADDGDHPNDAGHRAIAAAVRATLPDPPATADPSSPAASA